MVALSRSHIAGQARCMTFRSRRYNENDISSSLATSLKANCPGLGGNNNLFPFDITSLTVLRQHLLQQLGELKGPASFGPAVVQWGSTNPQVTGYSENLGSITNDFTNAMVKMGALSPLTRSTSQIRTDCRIVD